MTARTGVAVALAVAGFVVVATANSGGYRYGVSDQAFYVPAVAYRADPTLFPRDRDVIEPQMHLWIGDDLLGAVVRHTGVSIENLFGLLYLATMAGLALSAVQLSRQLRASGWTTALTLVLLTLRHRIAKTGANSLEGYFHPRMLAFAIGLAALAGLVSGRFRRSAVLVLLAAVVHPTTALWFGMVVAGGWAWTRWHTLSLRQHPPTGRAIAAIAGIVILGVGALLTASHVEPRMDAEWLSVLGEKDYLFPTDWPAYAWITNLLSPVVIVAIYRARRRRLTSAPGEPALVAGLLTLVITFLVSVPLAAQHWTTIVQLQVNRVFWVLDAVTVVYVSWWLMDAGGARRALRPTVVAALLAAALGRGLFVLHEAHRPLASWRLESSDWTDAMRWIQAQPSRWHVLADPGHAWKFGSSVRVAARRDTLVEASKDAAMALYNRGVAMRVAERLDAVRAFDEFTADDVARLARRFDLDVMVDRTDRTFPWAVLYRNGSFVIYDLRR